MTSQKSEKIQILRGISIVAVVLIHCTPLGTAQIVARPFFEFLCWLVPVSERDAVKRRKVETEKTTRKDSGSLCYMVIHLCNSRKYSLACADPCCIS